MKDTDSALKESVVELIGLFLDPIRNFPRLYPETHLNRTGSR